MGHAEIRFWSSWIFGWFFRDLVQSFAKDFGYDCYSQKNTSSKKNIE